MKKMDRSVENSGAVASSMVTSVWPYIWWFMITVCVPISVPWFLYKYIRKSVYKRIEKLQGKVVLVTGASSGLGEALAHAFYKSGCKVILASRRKEELEKVKNDLLRSYSTKPTYPPVVLPLDLSDLNALPARISEAVSIFGHIDILVNNGGISYRGAITTTNVEVDIKVMLINYFGQVAITKAVLPSMIERHEGHIVAVSSVQGRVAIPYRSAYAASKHAVQAFYDTLRAEVHDSDIKITVVSPGYIRTSLSINAITGSGQTHGVMDETTASGFLPNEVAEKIVHAVVKEEKELTIATYTPKIAIFLRTLFPSIYFWIMNNRASRLKKDYDVDKDK